MLVMFTLYALVNVKSNVQIDTCWQTFTTNIEMTNFVLGSGIVQFSLMFLNKRVVL